MKRWTGKFAKTIALMLMVVMLFSIAVPMVSAQEGTNYADDEVSLEWWPNHPTGNPFTDVPQHPHWQSAPVSWAFENGITGGVGDGTTFNPNGNLNRQMFATFLHRLAGLPPAETGGGGFTDQGRISDWAVPAVNWASSVGIVSGFPDGSFGPQRPIQRQQIAAMLYRFAEHLGGIDMSAPVGALTRFPDHGRVAGWATTPMRWAVQNGLITGIDGSLRPTNNASRAQTVTMLQRFVNTFRIPAPRPAALVGTWAIEGAEIAGAFFVFRANGTGTMLNEVNEGLQPVNIKWWVTGGDHLSLCLTPAACDHHTCSLQLPTDYNHGLIPFRFDGNILVLFDYDELRFVRLS